MISTSQIGRYAAIPAQMVANVILAVAGKESRYRGHQAVISDDADEHSRGRSEYASEILVPLLYLNAAMAMLGIVNLADGRMPIGVEFGVVYLGLVFALLTVVTLAFFEAEAIRKSDAEAV